MERDGAASVGGLVVLVTAPSGAGKDSALRILRDRGADVHWATTAVTREPRPHEVDGRDHYFRTPELFAEERARGWFLETAEVYGRRYGTPLHEVREPLARGEDVVLRLDVQGARELKRRYPEAIVIFVEPPSAAEAERRMRARATESEAEIARRMEAMRRYEMDFAREADYRVPSLTDAQEGVADAIWAIITAERLRSRPRTITADRLAPAVEAQPI